MEQNGYFTLLVVDSNKNFRESAQLYLQANNLVERVDTVSGIDEALFAAGRLQPDFILVDSSFLLEKGSFIYELRNIKRLIPEVRIIVLTLFRDHLGCADLPEAELINEFVSKENFAGRLETIISRELERKSGFLKK